MTWFVVTLPDSTTQEFELPDRSKGQDLLDAVCEKLEVIEQDYFGLQYNGPKGEKLWLNRRNKIGRQVPGSQPYRLRFRMKFFVEPHLLVEDNTKHYCFLTCKKDFEENTTVQDDEQLTTRIHAQLLQATLGDYERAIFSRHSTRLNWSQEFSHAVAIHYSALAGTKASSAEYNCLKEFFSLEDFGYEYHNVKTDDNAVCSVGVGREGLQFCDEHGTVIRRVAYGALNKAWRENRCFALVITNDDGTSCKYDLRLITAEACIQLFRSVTEAHSFFGCETVNSTVRNQYTRDFKDSIISFFSEETSEKLYTFDVDKTVIEVHDHVRRVLYREKQNASNLEEIPSEIDLETISTESTDEQNIGELRQKLDNIQQAFLCKICMDAKIDTVLIPCGHWVCCNICGSNIDTCPLCRTGITLQQRVYMNLPGIFDAETREVGMVSPEEMHIDESACR